MTHIQLSPRAAAVLLYRVTAPRLSPVVKAAERHERKLALLFLRSVREVQNAISMKGLLDALSVPGTGSALYELQPALDLLFEETHFTVQHETYVRAAEEKKTVHTILLDTLKDGAKASKVKFDITFDATNPEAVAWAERNAAKLVRDVTNDARKAVRVAITDGVAGNVPRPEVTKLIRASIGLTERDAAAVMKHQIDLMEKGITPSSAASRAEKYADKLTRARAQTIARTETMKAANEGQMQLWKQAKDAGLLTGKEKKVWIVADPCPICAGLSGEKVGLNEDFSIGSDPPAHPRCRCTIGLVA